MFIVKNEKQQFQSRSRNDGCGTLRHKKKFNLVFICADYKLQVRGRKGERETERHTEKKVTAYENYMWCIEV